MGEPIETSHVLRFGIFEFNARARELRKQGVRIKLQEQPFQVLSSLLEHADQVVTRDQLRQKVWPSNVYVDFDHRLNNAIARLREVLGDVAGTSRFIETVPRVGYRFIHSVEVVPLTPRAVEETRANESPLLAPALSEPVVTPRRWSARQRALVGEIGGVVIVSLIAAGWIAWQRADETGAANLSDGAVDRCTAVRQHERRRRERAFCRRAVGGVVEQARGDSRLERRGSHILFLFQEQAGDAV